jgi:hypothetical protein
MVLLFACYEKLQNFRIIKFITLAFGVNRLPAEIWLCPAPANPHRLQKNLDPRPAPGYINLNNLDLRDGRMRLTPPQFRGGYKVTGQKIYGALGLLPRALRTIAGALTLLSRKRRLFPGRAATSGATGMPAGPDPVTLIPVRGGRTIETNGACLWTASHSGWLWL